MDVLTEPWTFPAATIEQPAGPAGPRLHLVDMPGQEVVAVASQVALPSSVEPPEQEGIVSLLADAHQAGFADRRRAPIYRRSALALHGGCDHQGPKFLADCLPDETPLAVRQLLRVTAVPDVTEPEWRAIVDRRMTELAAETSMPAGFVNKLFQEAIHDPSHRCARPLGGSSASVGRLDRADLTRLVHTWVRPSAVDVVVVGDLRHVPLPAVWQLVAAYRDAGDTGPRPEPVYDPARGRSGPSRIVRPAPLAGVDAFVMAGNFSIDRRDPDWPAARLIAQLLGGSVDSILSTELRGRRSLTYGVDARFVPYESGGVFVIKASTARDRMGAALGAMRERLLAVRRDGFDVRTLRAERSRMADEAPRVYESSLGVAQQYAELISCGLPRTYVDEHLECLVALRTEDVHAALLRLVDPDLMHIAVVGNQLELDRA